MKLKCHLDKYKNLFNTKIKLIIKKTQKQPLNLVVFIAFKLWQSCFLTFILYINTKLQFTIYCKKNLFFNQFFNRCTLRCL